MRDKQASAIQNILFITTDQQRRETLPCYGQSFMQTPSLDSLCESGMVFEQAISVSPLCQPARASFMVGQYPSVTGVPNNFHWIAESAPTIADAFNAAGWKTAAIGKMHFEPWDSSEGFAHRIIAEDKRHYFRPDHHATFLEEQGIKRDHPGYSAEYWPSLGAMVSPLTEEQHIDTFIADAAVDYLSEIDASDRFFCWVSFNSPHDPYDPPAGWEDLYRDVPFDPPVGSAAELAEKPAYQKKIIDFFKRNPLYLHDFETAGEEHWRRIRELYYSSISFIDKQVGRILAVLEERGLKEQTLIVFSSDHGDHVGDHGLPYKGTFYEGSIGVPCIASGPGVLANSRCSAFVDWVDLHRTFLEIADIPVADHVQGESMTPFFSDPTLEGKPVAFSELDGKIMGYDGRYKLVLVSDGGGELYDLEQDPDEIINYYDHPEYTEIQHTLSVAIAQHLVHCNTVRRFGGGRHGSDPNRDQAFTEIERALSEGLFPREAEA